MRIVYTPLHHLHATENLVLDGNPFVIEELPARAELILQAIQKAGIDLMISPTDHGIQPIQAVHAVDYIDYLQRAYTENVAFYRKDEPVVAGTFAGRGARRNTRHIYGQAGYYSFGIGAPILKGTWESAYWSAQCALTAADQLLCGERVVYALCRPPGHHATVDQCGGFCYLNNAAIAARYLQSSQQMHAMPCLSESTKEVRIAILDIDYHHGNGTQEIFYTDPSVFYCSLHAHPDDDYPYFWGSDEEIGEAAGLGFNLNIPLPQNTGDSLYLEAFERALLSIRSFSPAFLVVSAGLDTYIGDPVGGFSLTTLGIAEIGRRIAALELPSLLLQEGGYLLDKLGENAVALLSGFMTR